MRIRDLPHPDPGVPDVRSGFRFLLWLGRMQLGGQLKALGWGVLHLTAMASFPVVAGLAVDAVVDRSGERLLGVAGVMLCVTLAVTVGDTMLHRVAVTNWITAAARVQQLLARQASTLGATLTRRVAAGEVVAVSTGDIERIGWCVEAVSRFSAAVLTTLAVCAGLVVHEPRLGLLACAGTAGLVLVVLPLLPRATRRADAQRERAGLATELAADTVAGLRVLRGIGGEELFLRRYRDLSQQVRRAAVRTARMWALIEALQVALPGLLLVGVVWYGTGLALDGQIAVGELVTVYGAMSFLLFPLRLFGEFAMSYSFSRPSAARAARVLALRRATVDADAREEGSGTAGGGPEARSGQRDGLYDPVTGLRAAPGRLTAVVCGDPDAAGRLAERLGGHPPSEAAPPEGAPPEGAPADASPSTTAPAGQNAPAGRDAPAVGRNAPAEGGAEGHNGTADAAPHTSVLLDGVPLDRLPLDTARSTVLVQDKDPTLLSGTLDELFAVPASGQVTMDEALASAQCDDVLTALLQGSPDADGDPRRARITERGRSLSGGQRQRLALARSLLTDPPVLVLDEPTSAVDSHTEARTARALRRLRAGRTTVVLTSSPLLLDQADEVVFVPCGTVAAVGTHQELLRTDPAYRAVVTREPEPTPPAALLPAAPTGTAQTEGTDSR